MPLCIHAHKHRLTPLSATVLGSRRYNLREEEPEPVKPKREEDTGYHVIQEAEMASPIPRRAGRFDRDEGGRHGMRDSSDTQYVQK